MFDFTFGYLDAKTTMKSIQFGTENQSDPLNLWFFQLFNNKKERREKLNKILNCCLSDTLL